MKIDVILFVAKSQLSSFVLFDIIAEMESSDNLEKLEMESSDNLLIF